MIITEKNYLKSNYRKTSVIDKLLGGVFITPLFLSIPFNKVFFFTFVIISPLILFRNLKINKRFVEFSPLHFSLLLFLIYVLINSLLVSGLDNFSLKYLVLFVEGLLVFIVLTSCFRKDDLNTLGYLIVFLSVLAFIQGLIHYYSEIGAVYKAEDSNGVYEVFRRPIPAGFDPNYYYLHLIFPICFTLYQLKFQQSIKGKISHIALLGIFLLSAFFTASKSGLLITIIIILFFSLKSLKDLVRFSLLILIIAFFVIPILSQYFPYSFLRYEGLFSNDITKVTTSRNIMWMISFENFMNNPIFGVGLGQMVKYFSNERYFVLIGGETTHNTFIHTLAELGIMGFVLFFKPYVQLAILTFKQHSYVFPVLFASAIMLLTIDAGYYKVIFVYLGIAYINVFKL